MFLALFTKNYWPFGTLPSYGPVNIIFLLGRDAFTAFLGLLLARMVLAHLVLAVLLHVIFCRHASFNFGLRLILLKTFFEKTTLYKIIQNTEIQSNPIFDETEKVFQVWTFCSLKKSSLYFQQYRLWPFFQHSI